MQRRGKTTDVKLGAGGIREIEFIVPSFQLIRGGRETAPQERRLLVVLDAGSLGHLPAAVVARLGEAVLRNTEHAIQARADQQTQAWPRTEHDRLRLAFALGFPDWHAFEAELERHRAHVRAAFRRRGRRAQEQHAAEQAASDAWRALWAMEKEPERLLELLEATGFEDPADTLKRLGALRNSNRLQALQARAASGSSASCRCCWRRPRPRSTRPR